MAGYFDADRLITANGCPLLLIGSNDRRIGRYMRLDAFFDGGGIHSICHDHIGGQFYFCGFKCAVARVYE